VQREKEVEELLSVRDAYVSRYLVFINVNSVHSNRALETRTLEFEAMQESMRQYVSSGFVYYSLKQE
jgi:hypothetical protein